MNKHEYYHRQKELWDDKETEDVRTEYETNQMTISQIADIHHRTPGSISYKLKSLGIVIHNTLTRGYLEYRNSNLYKEILEVSKKSEKRGKGCDKGGETESGKSGCAHPYNVCPISRNRRVAK